MYYAMYRKYGITTMSCSDILLRFATRRDRDAYVNGEEYDGSNYHRMAVSSSEASRYFPRAFAAHDSHYDQWLRDWDFTEGRRVKTSRDYWSGRPTGGEYRYING